MSRQVAEGDPDLMLLEIARISNASMRRLSGPIKDWMKIVWDGGGREENASGGGCQPFLAFELRK